MALRKTVDRDAVVRQANQMIAHLATSGTREDQIRREAIIAVTQSILTHPTTAEGDYSSSAYAGFRYLNPPHVVKQANGWDVTTYDDTRIGFY